MITADQTIERLNRIHVALETIKTKVEFNEPKAVVLAELTSVQRVIESVIGELVVS